MANDGQRKYPSLDEHIHRELEGLRRLREEGLPGVIHEGDTVSLSTEQAKNLLLVGKPAIRADIIETIRLQLEAVTPAG